MKTNNLQYFPPFKNQMGDTCQMHSVNAACQAIRRRAGAADEDLSPWYLLYEGQRRDGLPFTDTITPRNGSLAPPAMQTVLDVATFQGIPPHSAMPFFGAPSLSAHAQAAQAKITGSYSIPVDPYNGPATAALVRAALEKGHIISIGLKLRRWLRDLVAPESQHLQIAAAAVPGTADYQHMANHRMVISDCDDNFMGYQGLVFTVIGSAGDGWGGERGVAIVGPQLFKDALDIVAITGFAGCSDRYAYDADGTPAQVFRLYRAAFDRLPDKGGLGYQINAVRAGLPMWQLAINFMLSGEGQLKLPSTLTNEQYVDRLYDNVLHRPGDAGGIAWHLGNLNAGMARHDVLMQFSESPENKTACAPAFERGVAYT